MTYDFFSAQLRFIANRTEREPGDVADNLDALETVIEKIDGGAGSFHVETSDLRTTARALAGVAGFLQQHILPEAVAAGHAAGEAQIRWTIETCMSTMANLMSRAELDKDNLGLDVVLPPVPKKWG